MKSALEFYNEYGLTNLYFDCKRNEKFLVACGFDPLPETLEGFLNPEPKMGTQ